MTYPTAGRAWQAMRSLVLEQHDRRAEVCQALDMSFIKVKALYKLARGPMTMRELTDALATDKPYTTLVVDYLEDRGLVERTRHPEDRRSKIVTITAKGAAEAEKANAILGAPPAPLLALPEEDLAELDRILAKLAGD
ncbi:MarR family transcriptional regulator [Kutzneria kofuensis]|uniref:DNA-binding MarR family transcriptional regulator n=1 Tax=Kutzneria kofuensis TaxID=103725 RepID=A0A7W9KLF4_9PSEU|nr:MarR family transcriptional regulator [Kutzneria kofuensis]MBB5894748.1 DNA-binding MarR family transcriptional regulator [Kutzneria kofuensis]